MVLVVNSSIGVQNNSHIVSSHRRCACTINPMRVRATIAIYSGPMGQPKRKDRAMVHLAENARVEVDERLGDSFFPKNNKNRR